jgi:hypothetical protein
MLTTAGAVARDAVVGVVPPFEFAVLLLELLLHPASSRPAAAAVTAIRPLILTANSSGFLVG